MIRRPGIALPAALAALIVMTALAAMANVAARAALREAAIAVDDSRHASARTSLRARAAWQVAHTPRSVLLRGSVAVGQRDTLLTVTALAWPWHRVDVRVGASVVTAELARAATLSLPWCAAVVVGGSASIPPNSLSIASPWVCADTRTLVSPAGIAAFCDSLRASLALVFEPDSLIIATSSLDAQVIRAEHVMIEPGTQIRGVVVAREVVVGVGAIVEGVIIARDRLQISLGASVVADSDAVVAAVIAQTRLLRTGRAGLLLPP